jgi:hypothetical protein
MRSNIMNRENLAEDDEVALRNEVEILSQVIELLLKNIG